MDEIIKETPKSRSGRTDGGKWRAIIDKLIADPGEWYLLSTKSSYSASVYTWLKKRYPSCEFTTRQDGSVFKLYGRFIGSPSKGTS